MRGFESRLLPKWWSLRSAIPRRGHEPLVLGDLDVPRFTGPNSCFVDAISSGWLLHIA
jgi:hypothetical protein